MLSKRLTGSVMDNNPEDYGQKNLDHEDSVVSECLRNPIVLRTILEHFSSPELLQLSFVNKLWNYEARSLMRQRGHLTAYVKSHDLKTHRPLGEVEAFMSDLKQMNPVPFSGINFNLYFEFQFGPFPNPAFDPLEGVVLEQPPLLKTLSVKLYGLWLDHISSRGILLAKSFLQYSSGVLEELELFIDYGQEDFLEQVVQDCSFPRLKILKLREQCYPPSEMDYVGYLESLLSRAPNLKELHTNCPMYLVLNLLPGNSVVPVYTYEVAAPFYEISEFVISAIRLEKIKLLYTGPEFNFERFNRITPMILQASCTTTLRSMWLDALLAVPLMGYGISLKNVKDLTMGINFRYLDSTAPGILSIVKDFDFTRIFPNASRVTVVASKPPTPDPLNYIHGVIQQANAILREPLPDRAAKVKALDLDQRILSSEAAQFFAGMFPNIEKLEIVTDVFENVSFEPIWKNWLELKELKVGGNMLPTAGNLDSVFCGIFPEEVAELRLKDEDYLKRVNIVPVMPALTCLKNLRTLLLNHKDPWHFGGDATFLFSKVTALLAFARRPTLAVSLTFSSCWSFASAPVTTHLEPYVSFTFDELQEVEWDDYETEEEQ